MWPTKCAATPGNGGEGREYGEYNVRVLYREICKIKSLCLSDAVSRRFSSIGIGSEGFVMSDMRLPLSQQRGVVELTQAGLEPIMRIQPPPWV
jgi:hypothetical protein